MTKKVSADKPAARKGWRYAALREIRTNWLLFVMLLPAVVYALVFSYWPMSGIVLAFKDYKTRLGIFGSPWIGTLNFEFLKISGKLGLLTWNTLSYNLIFICLSVILEMGFAIILNEVFGKKFKKVLQTVMFLPYFISWVVVAAIMYNIFNFEKGTFNMILTAMGGEAFDLYNTGSAWRIVVPIVNAWKKTGYGMVVYLASITGLDQDMFEAASIDGANVWQKIRHITIPCLRPQMMILILLAIGNVFRGDFGLFYQTVKTNANILPYTDVLDTYVFRSLMTTGDIGMSAAAGLYQSVLCFVTICCANFLVKKVQPDYALF
ncbi:MAG: sugar ABC transporter permease [Clostridia bacterium]|nr:sugar ABC transporter permease [Clostridia bacterium]